MTNFAKKHLGGLLLNNLAETLKMAGDALIPAMVSELAEAFGLLERKTAPSMDNIALAYQSIFDNEHSEDGLYPPTINGLHHPLQDPTFPFIYHPQRDEYFAFRWDYGDTGPMPPPLTTEVIQSMGVLHVSPSPNDYYCTHGTNWDRRFTVVLFRPGNVYRAAGTVFDHRFLKSNYGGNLNPSEIPAQYVNYQPQPGLEPLLRAGYNTIFTPSNPQFLSEALILDPKTQVTRTYWWEIKH